MNEYWLKESGHSHIIIEIKRNVKKSVWRNIMGRKLTTDEFIAKARLVHGDKYDYSNSHYVTFHHKISIGCELHGEFYQSPANHLSGKKCASCVGNNFKKSTIQFIIDAKLTHNNMYDYRLVNYRGAHNKVSIICYNHGIFNQSPAHHLHGNGCPECKCEKLRYYNLDNLETFINKAIRIHGSKYDYSKFVYTKSNEKSIILCSKHGEFLQAPHNHLVGQGCSGCVGVISKSEIEFLNYLSISNTPKTRQVNILNKRVDGYNIQTNTIYEYLGDYWHGNPQRFRSSDYNKIAHKTYGELYNETFNRFHMLKANGYNIKYIWEYDWKRFKNSMDISPKIIDFI